VSGTRRTDGRRPRRRGLAVSVAVAAVGLVVIAGGLLLGHASGTRAEIVSTASMGTTAPVGSLLITRRVAPAAVHVGEVVVFHPPGQPHQTFVHRVVSVTAGPTGPLLTTRGDLSGSVDPWVVPARDLVGRTVTILPTVGWLLRMLPWLAVGVLLVWCCTVGLRIERRRAARVLGAVLVAILVLRHFRPLVDMELVSYGSTGSGGQLSGVPTGILPIRVAAVHHSLGAAHADPGQLFTTGSSAVSKDRLTVLARPWLHGLWWLLLATWALPLLPVLWTPRWISAAGDPVAGGGAGQPAGTAERGPLPDDVSGVDCGVFFPASTASARP
jgi:signal peptidase I